MAAARLLLERKQWSVSAVARALGISRPHLSANRKPSEPRGKSVAKSDDDLVSRIRRVVEKRGSYGYRRVTAVLNRQATSHVNHKRVYRAMKREGAPPHALHGEDHEAARGQGDDRAQQHAMV